MSNVIFGVWVQDKLAKPAVTRWTSLDVLGAFRGAARSRGGPKDGGSSVLPVGATGRKCRFRLDCAALGLTVLPRAVRQLADAYSDLYRRG